MAPENVPLMVWTHVASTLSGGFLVAPTDPDALKAWYRSAMRERVEELETLRPLVRGGDPTARTRARAVGHAIRGSGATFGFPEVSDAGAVLEDAPDAALPRRLEGVLAVLRRIAWPDRGVVVPSWLCTAAGLPDQELGTELSEAWSETAVRAGLSEQELAARVADYFALDYEPEPSPQRSALRLVPEALLNDYGVLPLSADGETIRIAISDPTNLAAELAVGDLSGRRVDLVVASPAALRPAIEDMPTGAPTSSAGSATPTGYAPVLLVDDDPVARTAARSVLEREGFRVLEASDGESALEVYRAERGIALAIVDLEMPGMGGRDLVASLRGQGATLPIIVLTSAADPELEADLIEAGADDYLHKPINARLFKARITATLRRAGA